MLHDVSSVGGQGTGKLEILAGPGLIGVNEGQKHHIKAFNNKACGKPPGPGVAGFARKSAAPYILL